MATVSPLDILSTLQPPQAILGAFGGDPATLHPRARRAVVAVERLAVRAVDDAARVGAVGLVDIFRPACWAPRAEIAMAWAGWSCQAVVAGLLLLDAVDLARARAPKGLVTLQKRWRSFSIQSKEAESSAKLAIMTGG